MGGTSRENSGALPRSKYVIEGSDGDYGRASWVPGDVREHINLCGHIKHVDSID